MTKTKKTKTKFPAILLCIVLIAMTACNIVKSVPQGRTLPVIGVTPTKPLLTDLPASTAITTATAQPACIIQDSNPIGLSISETYKISYEQVMTWNCEGYPFEDILLALETSQSVQVPTTSLLKMSLEKEWDEIWKEIGFVTNN